MVFLIFSTEIKAGLYTMVAFSITDSSLDSMPGSFSSPRATVLRQWELSIPTTLRLRVLIVPFSLETL